MRRAALLAFVLALLLVGAPANAATAGGKCVKVGSKSTKGTVQLVCKRNAQGKATWTVANPKPLPTATPTTPTRPLEIWEVAQQKLDLAWKNKKSLDLPIQIEYQTSFPISKWANDAIGYLQPSVDFFSAIGVPVNSKVLLIVGDYSYVKARTKELGCRNIGEDEISDNCGAGIIFLNVTTTGFMHNIESVLIHELFHEAQRQAASSVERDRYHYPLWLRQGGAELVRNYVFGKVTGLGYGEMRQFQIAHKEKNCESFSIAETVAQGRLTTEPSKCDYTGGLLSVERLVALSPKLDVFASWVLRTDVSLELVNKVLSAYNSIPVLTTESHARAIEKIYGVSSALFEIEMNAYVQSQLSGR